MASVFFAFREQTTENSREALVERIRQLPGVETAAPLKPNAERSSLRRLFYAEVTDDEAAHRLVEHLQRESEVETAELPATRMIIEAQL